MSEPFFYPSGCIKLVAEDQGSYPSSRVPDRDSVRSAQIGSSRIPVEHIERNQNGVDMMLQIACTAIIAAGVVCEKRAWLSFVRTKDLGMVESSDSRVSVGNCPVALVETETEEDSSEDILGAE